MTVLVSVLQDAFSSKYKSAVHNGVFENAVKKYRQKMKIQSKKKAKEEAEKELKIPVRVRPSVAEEVSARVQRSLEGLPGKVLERAKVFHRYIHHLVQGEPVGAVSTDLRSMLDDISRTRKLDEKIKDEILKDEDARNRLCVLIIERALRELIDIAENTQSAVAERDLMAVGVGPKEQQQAIECDISEVHDSGSGSCHHDTAHDSDA